MSYQIEIKRSAAKSLQKIPKADRIRIVKKIDSFAESLPNPEMTKMKGNNPKNYIAYSETQNAIYNIENDVPLMENLIC